MYRQMDAIYFDRAVRLTRKPATKNGKSILFLGSISLYICLFFTPIIAIRPDTLKEKITKFGKRDILFKFIFRKIKIIKSKSLHNYSF